MTQRNRRRQRRRGGIGGKLLLILGGIFAAIAIAAVAVASWVLDVAADAPSLASCKPVERGGNTTLYAADGSKLGPVASAGGARPRSRSSGSRRACSWRRWRSRTSASTSTAGVDPEGNPPRHAEEPRSRRSGRGRLDDHPAAGPEPLHRQPRAHDRAQDRRGEAGGSSTPSATRAAESSAPTSTSPPTARSTGSTAVGVGAASRFYFSKPVWELSLPQAALLAGLPQAPSQYNPILNPRAAKARRNAVLRKMAKLGYVTGERARAAEAGGAAGWTSPTATSSTASPTSSTTSKTG